MKTSRTIRLGAILAALGVMSAPSVAIAAPALAGPPSGVSCKAGDVQVYGPAVGKNITYGRAQACQKSPDSHSFAIFQSDGNFVVYSDTTGHNVAKWNSGTQNRGCTLVFQTDGNVVIYDCSHRAVWSIKHSSSFPGYYDGRMQNNAVFYVEQAGYYRPPSNSNHPVVVWAS